MILPDPKKLLLGAPYNTSPKCKMSNSAFVSWDTQNRIILLDPEKFVTRDTILLCPPNVKCAFC